jgi:hypothetical protein
MAEFRFIAASALIALSLPMAALAAGLPAEQGAEVLARARSLDAKCNFLDARGKDKLSKFTARAELALANRETMEATKATMKRGHDAGQAADCSAAEKDTVQQLLAAAIQATEPVRRTAKLAASPELQAAVAQPADAKAWPMTQSVKADTNVPMMPADPVPASLSSIQLASGEPPLAPSVAKFPKVKEPAQITAAKTLKAKPASPGLGTYERLTQAYYMARRCGGRNLGSTYQAVVAEHGRVMASHSAAEVSAVLHQAEARAGSAICS